MPVLNLNPIRKVNMLEGPRLHGSIGQGLAFTDGPANANWPMDRQFWTPLLNISFAVMVQLKRYVLVGVYSVEPCFSTLDIASEITLLPFMEPEWLQDTFFKDFSVFAVTIIRPPLRLCGPSVTRIDHKIEISCQQGKGGGTRSNFLFNLRRV